MLTYKCKKMNILKRNTLKRLKIKKQLKTLNFYKKFNLSYTLIYIQLHTFNIFSYRGNVHSGKNLISINQKLDIILAMLNDKNRESQNLFDLLPDFPINNEEDFKHFCKELHADKEVREQFVS